MIPKVKAIHAGGYDPALGPRHPANQDPTLEAHVIEIETKPPEASPPGVALHRWICSCGASPGEWKTREVQARIGGTKHATRADRKRR